MSAVNTAAGLPVAASPLPGVVSVVEEPKTAVVVAVVAAEILQTAAGTLVAVGTMSAAVPSTQT